jgi:hypothetical protein
MRPMSPTCPRPLASMPRASPTGERLSVCMGVGVGVGADGVQSMCGSDVLCLPLVWQVWYGASFCSKQFK